MKKATIRKYHYKICLSLLMLITVYSVRAQDVLFEVSAGTNLTYGVKTSGIENSLFEQFGQNSKIGIGYQVAASVGHSFNTITALMNVEHAHISYTHLVTGLVTSNDAAAMTSSTIESKIKLFTLALGLSVRVEIGQKSISYIESGISYSTVVGKPVTATFVAGYDDSIRLELSSDEFGIEDSIILSALFGTQLFGNQERLFGELGLVFYTKNIVIPIVDATNIPLSLTAGISYRF